MQKISEKICLIFLLVLVATSCMAQAAALQNVEGKNLLQHLINKRGSCAGGYCRVIDASGYYCTGAGPDGLGSCVLNTGHGGGGGGSFSRK
jgi:hypothetical protein